MGEELEEEVAPVDEQQDNRDAVGEGEEIGFFFVGCDGGSGAVCGGGDTEMERRGDEDGDDGEEEERGIELGGGSHELLFSVSCAAAAGWSARMTRKGEGRRTGGNTCRRQEAGYSKLNQPRNFVRLEARI